MHLLPRFHKLAGGACLIAALAAGCTATTVAAPAVTPSTVPGAVGYYQGTTGYLALPGAAGPHPGVVMIHEWWGLNDQIKGKADELAREGYVVLAVDLYKGKVATTAQEAQTQSQALNQDDAKANMQAAVTFLRARPDVRADKVASLGWCFGGGQSLKLAQAQHDLAATVIFYGQLSSDAAALKGLPPILCLFGEADQTIPVGQVQTFDQALTQAGTPHEIHTYPGAPHAFANPTNSSGYRADAAADAWTKTLAFLKAKLQ
ncbi:MAG: dienelactone hydrolase family protein [Cyanobacteria bacterium RYN_339]|nr:dienelactone hydrolase family protein [Cyanobacteria bacterium RYN_339]